MHGVEGGFDWMLGEGLAPMKKKKKKMMMLKKKKKEEHYSVEGE